MAREARKRLAIPFGARELNCGKALRVIAIVAVLVMTGVGFLIYRNRHKFFDRDPDVDDDLPVVRHMRTEEILLVWSGLTILSISILLQVW